MYHRSLFISIGESDPVLEKKLQKWNITQEEIDSLKYDGTTSMGKCYCFNNGAGIIRLKQYPNTPESQGSLAHEIFHMTTFFMERVGIGILNTENDKGNDEAYAYLCGYITEKIYNLL